MNVYLSGPMSGYPEFNYPAFAEATARLREHGYSVYSPHERLTNERAPTQTELRAAFADYSRYICLQADMVVVLPGWERSKGATTEVGLAVNCGLMVLRYEKVDPLVALLDREFVEAL